MHAPDDRWFEAVVQADSRDADLVADVFTAHGAEGVVTEPAIAIRDDADFAYDELTDRPWTVRATFGEPFGAEERARLRAHLADLALAAPIGALAVREVEPVDWAEQWKQFYRRQHIGQRLVIVPSWEHYEPAPGEVVVALDPGAAFGTGEHETTRLCLAALEAHLAPGARVLDVGSGSGILAIAAKRLGAGDTRAIDVDPDTLRVARENAARNAIEEGAWDGIAFAVGSLGPDWPAEWADVPASGDTAYDLVLANISSTVLGRLADHLSAALRPGGLLIASGFILRDAEEVRSALVAAGLEKVDYLTEGNWGCLVLRRKSTGPA